MDCEACVAEIFEDASVAHLRRGRQVAATNELNQSLGLPRPELPDASLLSPTLHRSGLQFLEDTFGFSNMGRAVQEIAERVANHPRWVHHIGHPPGQHP